MKCPCGCKREVPHGHFWFDDKCRRRGNKAGIHAPKNRSPIERMFHVKRSKYEPKERIRFGKQHSLETRRKISEGMKRYYKKPKIR